MKIKPGQIWKWKASGDNAGFEVISIATHPSRQIEKKIITYRPTNCYVNTDFYRDEEEFLGIMELVKDIEVVFKKQSFWSIFKKILIVS